MEEIRSCPSFEDEVVRGKHSDELAGFALVHASIRYRNLRPSDFFQPCLRHSQIYIDSGLWDRVALKDVPKWR